MMYTIISFPLIQALGWTLIHSLWQILAVAFSLRILLRISRRESPAFRYTLSLGALFVLCLWSTVTFFQCYEAIPDLRVNMTTLSEPSLSHPDLVLSEGIETVISLPEMIASGFKNIGHTLTSWLPYIVVGWLAGIGLLGLRFMGGFVYIRRLRRRSQPFKDVHWQQRLSQLAQQMGIQRGIQLLDSIHISEPMTIGFFKPVILLPLGIVTGLTPEQVEAILLHELAHIRRKDYLINLVQTGIETVFFFHPGIWWINRQARIEREQCCDDLAVQVCRNPISYAEALIHIQSLSTSQQPILVMSATGNNRAFTARIHRLFHSRPSGFTPIHTLLPMLFMAALLSAFTILPVHFDNNQKKPIVIEITQDLTSQQLDLMIEKLASKNISLTIEDRDFNNGQLTGIKGSVKYKDCLNTFTTDRLESIRIFLDGEGKNDCWLEVNQHPNSHLKKHTASKKNPTVIEITSGMSERQLNLLVEKLAMKGIILTIENKNFNDGKLTSIRASLHYHGSNNHFQTDNLEKIRVTLNGRGEGSYEVEVNPDN